jgi:hypothetical protein
MRCCRVWIGLVRNGVVGCCQVRFRQVGMGAVRAFGPSGRYGMFRFGSEWLAVVLNGAPWRDEVICPTAGLCQVRFGPKGRCGAQR